MKERTFDGLQSGSSVASVAFGAMSEAHAAHHGLDMLTAQPRIVRGGGGGATAHAVGRSWCEGSNCWCCAIARTRTGPCFHTHQVLFGEIWNAVTDVPYPPTRKAHPCLAGSSRSRATCNHNNKGSCRCTRCHMPVTGRNATRSSIIESSSFIRGLRVKIK